MAQFFDEGVRVPILARVPRWVHPNHLTFLRFALIGPLLWIGPGWVAVSIAILSSIFDLFDGPLARVRGQTSKFGAFMDPLADKLFLLPAMRLLCWTQLPHALFYVILGMDIALTALRIYKDKHGIPTNANQWGAWKVWTQSFGLCFLLTHSRFFEPLGVPVLFASVWYAVLSLVGHLSDFRRHDPPKPQNLTHEEPEHLRRSA
jgi:CDP-diacylglycerol--glycerol-3-phosphate 3-phosphatidyltransferase